VFCLGHLFSNFSLGSVLCLVNYSLLRKTPRFAAVNHQVFGLVLITLAFLFHITCNTYLVNY
jgi:hypothetical protein